MSVDISFEAKIDQVERRLKAKIESGVWYCDGAPVVGCA